MQSPDYLTSEQVSFLVQFYPMVYSLSGGFESNTELRQCLAEMLLDYPDVMTNPMQHLKKFQEWNRDKPKMYQGDLEADYLHFLGHVQKAAKENPINVEFDFL